MTNITWSYPKGEAADFNADIANTDAFESFKYKPKLLDDSFSDGAIGIVRNTAIVVSLNYLSNFRRSLKMSLINCKVELTLK